VRQCDSTSFLNSNLFTFILICHWPDQISFFSFLQPFSHTCDVTFHILYPTIFSHVTCGMTYCGDMMQNFLCSPKFMKFFQFYYIYMRATFTWGSMLFEAVQLEILDVFSPITCYMSPILTKQNFLNLVSQRQANFIRIV
jgi:hypothetical protein